MAENNHKKLFLLLETFHAGLLTILLDILKVSERSRFFTELFNQSCNTRGNEYFPP